MYIMWDPVWRTEWFESIAYFCLKYSIVLVVDRIVPSVPHDNQL